MQPGQGHAKDINLSDDSDSANGPGMGEFPAFAFLSLVASFSNIVSVRAKLSKDFAGCDITHVFAMTYGI